MGGGGSLPEELVGLTRLEPNIDADFSKEVNLFASFGGSHFPAGLVEGVLSDLSGFVRAVHDSVVLRSLGTIHSGDDDVDELESSRPDVLEEHGHRVLRAGEAVLVTGGVSGDDED